MFSISKIVTFLFLPPGIFLLILLASILLLLLATRRPEQKIQQKT